MVYLDFINLYVIIMSSPFVFVFRDDCVTYHTRVDDIPGDAVDA